MIPSLAVVGHPNKGKSSIVATLAENTQVAISPVPGTTRGAHHYTLTLNDEPLYDLIDTPGFQRAGQLYNWLMQHGGDASDRPDLVREFVDQHRQDPNFADECALLQPILDGAGILYVVDGSKPYGAEYELEMEILRFTGRPRMALINMIGSGDYRDAWHAGLGQYFSIVREFNAHQASFEQRLALLRGFGELEETWRQPLQRAVHVLEAHRKQQLHQSSLAISDLLHTALRAKVEKRLPAQQVRPEDQHAQAEQLRTQLQTQLQKEIQNAERRCQREVQRIYRHDASTISSAQLELVETDLFTEQAWQLFGLSRTQLLITGAASGAVAGGALDVLVGGTSLLLGSVIGGALGSITAWLGGPELAKIKVLGSYLGGDIATAGPIGDTVNFPWVLLGRACLVHHALISERNHAVREAVVTEFSDTENFFDFLDTNQRLAMERLFARLRRSNDDLRTELAKQVADTLTAYVS